MEEGRGKKAWEGRHKQQTHTHRRTHTLCPFLLLGKEGKERELFHLPSVTELATGVRTVDPSAEEGPKRSEEEEVEEKKVNRMG